MKNLIAALIFLMAIVFTGCSSDDTSDTTPVTPVEPAAPLSELYIDGIPVINQPTIRAFKVYKKADEIEISIASGPTGYQYQLQLDFSDDGAFIIGKMDYSYFNYYNYMHFPSNYVKVSDFSLDREKKKVSIKFSGKLYVDQSDLNSEYKIIEGDINATYEDLGGEETVPYQQIKFWNVDQYCLAKFNGKSWKARFENDFSSFTSSDAYKIEINFADSPNPGSYTFDSNSTANYVRLSKFNPLTLTYDYYNVTGQVAYSYREFHGGGRYSFIGTFAFTATNPANPQDVIQVTDGEFRSYQQF